MKPSPDQHPLPMPCRGPLLAAILTAALVLAVFLGATFLLWKHARQDAIERLHASFDLEVQGIGKRLQDGMEKYEQALLGAQGLFAASKSVERDEFHAYAEMLHPAERLPGMGGIGYIAVVPAEEKGQHIAAVRKEGFPEYGIRPEGEREAYSSVVYIEPFSGRNLLDFGYDYLTEPVRLEAMGRARDSGKIAVSRKVPLVHGEDAAKYAGFRMYAPVYENGKPVATVAERRARLLGWVYAPFNVHELMDHVLGNYAARFDIEIYGGNEVAAPALMVDSDGLLRSGNQYGSRFQTTTRIVVADQIWTLQATSLPLFEEQAGGGLSGLTAIGGALAGFIAALLAGFLAYRGSLASPVPDTQRMEKEEPGSRPDESAEDSSILKLLFRPAIALMDRLRYARKFGLLWLVSLAAILVVIYGLIAALKQEITIAERELEGITLIAPVTRLVQSVQLHRGNTAMLLAGHQDPEAQAGHVLVEKEAARNFDAVGEKLPTGLRETGQWKNIRNGWEHLQQQEHAGISALEGLNLSTRLIYDLLFFEMEIADQYALTLDPQIDTYYLIDTAINKLPSAIDHIGQLRAHGAVLLVEKRVDEARKAQINKIMGMLSDAVEASGVNLEKTMRHNPAMRESLQHIPGIIGDAANRVVGIIESEMFAGRFTGSPREFFEIATLAMGEGYRQIHESLLPKAENLLRQRIARAENTMRVMIGISVLLLLGVAYLTAGVYFSIAGNVRALARSARAFAGGNLDERVNLGTRDELAQVGGSFNEMADGFGAMLAARKQAEEALNQFKNTLDQTRDCVFMFSPDTLRFIYANRGAAEQVGYSIGELLQLTPLDIKPEFNPESFRNMLEPLLSGQQAATTFETVHRHKDGHSIPVEVALQYVHSGGMKGRFIAIVRDITERKRVEGELKKSYEELKALNTQLQEAHNQLLQSEKMASIGQLAAGVAHEINNPIGYVYSNLGTLEKYMRDTFAMIEKYEALEKLITDDVALSRLKEAREKLDIDFLKEDLRALMAESKDGIVRVKNIVQNLKDFSHVDASDEWHYSDLHKGLDSTLNIVHNELKYKAEVVKEYGELPEVECLLSQLNQVFMNLLVNAAHAIEERGTIFIRTGAVRTGRQGEEVWVEIADTGKGIKPEHIKKIFDPFFTTKPVGKGTGLGLSLSYGIVQKHHGRIEVESEPGKGATFRVWLPVRQPQGETLPVAS